MNILRIGRRSVPYTIRENTRTKRITLHITPDKTEVVVPPDTPLSLIEDFLLRKKQWIYNKVRDMEESLARPCLHLPETFVSGAKIPYRGRMVKIIVSPEKIPDVIIRYQNGFHIRIPDNLKEPDKVIRYRLRNWMKIRVEKDCHAFARYYSRKLRLIPKAILVKKQKHLWGSCSEEGIIRINRQLAFAPKQVLEYVLAHEICHLQHRNHTEAFWKLLSSVFPARQYCKDWLEKHESEWESCFL